MRRISLLYFTTVRFVVRHVRPEISISRGARGTLKSSKFVKINGVS
jgi:hypothetical protein